MFGLSNLLKLAPFLLGAFALLLVVTFLIRYGALTSKLDQSEDTTSRFETRQRIDEKNRNTSDRDMCVKLGGLCFFHY